MLKYTLLLILYFQLNQVEMAIQAFNPDENLIQLRADLKELISLTEGNSMYLFKALFFRDLWY